MIKETDIKHWQVVLPEVWELLGHRVINAGRFREELSFDQRSGMVCQSREARMVQ